MHTPTVPIARQLTLLLAAWVFGGAAIAADFKNIGPGPVVMYDAPSARGQKLYIAPRGMPVEVVISYGAWVRVRDVAGDLSWIEAKHLSERKNIVVRVLNAKVRQTADEASAVVFSADKGVVLEWLETGPSGWVKVRHSDGTSGFVRASEVWGV